MHAAFVVDEIWGDILEPARTNTTLAYTAAPKGSVQFSSVQFGRKRLLRKSQNELSYHTRDGA